MGWRGRGYKQGSVPAGALNRLTAGKWRGVASVDDGRTDGFDEELARGRWRGVARGVDSVVRARVPLRGRSDL